MLAKAEREPLPLVAEIISTPAKHCLRESNLSSVLQPNTKFQVSTFSRSRDREGVPKFKNWSRDPGHTPFDDNLSLAG